jgi:hypothetical protein
MTTSSALLRLFGRTAISRSRVTIVCLLAFCASLGAAEIQSTVPKQFRGNWAAGAKDCRAGSAESKLAIQENRIDFYGSRGRILAIATEGTNELALLIEATGEGQTWLATRQFKLSPDGQSLTDMTGGGHSTVRIRCESPSK